MHLIFEEMFYSSLDNVSVLRLDWMALLVPRLTAREGHWDPWRKETPAALAAPGRFRWTRSGNASRVAPRASSEYSNF